jgi:hypothetical protein
VSDCDVLCRHLGFYGFTGRGVLGDLGVSTHYCKPIVVFVFAEYMEQPVKSLVTTQDRGVSDWH